MRAAAFHGPAYGAGYSFFPADCRQGSYAPAFSAAAGEQAVVSAHKFAERDADELVPVHVGMDPVRAEQVLVIVFIQELGAHVDKEAARLARDLADGVGIEFLEAVDHVHVAEPLDDILL